MYADRIFTPNLEGFAVGTNVIDGYTIATSFTTNPIPLHHFIGYSVTVSCPSTGSPVGTFKIQGCNDLERRDGQPDANLVNWFDIASGGDRVVSQAVSNATVGALSDPQCMYRWLRIVYTRTSGTITATIKLQRKTIK